MVCKGEACGMLEGFSLKEGGSKVSFIQFAYGSLFLLDDDLEELRCLRCILLILEAVFGLKGNLRKSILLPIGDVANIEEMTQIMECEVESLPTIYLGHPLGAKASSKSIWNPVIKRLDRRLASWKGRCLSKGGKLVLLRCVISSLPLYYLSLSMLLQSLFLI